MKDLNYILQEMCINLTRSQFKRENHKQATPPLAPCLAMNLHHLPNQTHTQPHKQQTRIKQKKTRNIP